jgi:predicted acetyltransferase
MLKLALSRTMTFGFDRVLLTCNDDNLGSIKIIEGAGGVLEDKIEVGGPTLHRRYWISI